MIAPLLDFLEGIVHEVGIKNVVKEAAQQKLIALRPLCHLIPKQGDVTRDWDKVGKDIYDPGAPDGGLVTQYRRKWVVENPVRVVFIAGKDCERYGMKFLELMPRGFVHEGQYIDITITSELPPLDDSLLYDAGEIAYDVTFTSGVYVPIDKPMFRDTTVKGEILHGQGKQHAHPGG